MSPLWIVLTLLPIIGGAERFNCRGRILGAYYADAKSGCKAFHVCVRVAGGGIRDFRFFCPPGTLFHQEAQTCTDWGDDDPLACPADIYDGQFDLYKIGSGFDTKKVSSSASRDDEAEFGLQRADSGDRRLSQGNAASNSGASDLRTAHSSDFFTGQRERGRDEPSVPSSVPSSSRQSYRRPVTSRTPPTTQYTATVPTTSPATTPPQRDIGSKRKLVRKRPIYVSTAAPKQEQSSNPQQFTLALPQQNFDRKLVPQNKPTLQPVSIPPHYKDYQDEYVEVSRVTPKPKGSNGKSYSVTFTQPTSTPQYSKKETLIEVYNYNAQTNPNFKGKADNNAYKLKNNFNVSPNVPNETNLRGNIQISSNGARDASTTPELNTAPPKTFTSSTPSYRNFNSVSYESEKKSYNSFSGPKQTYFSSPVTTQSTSTLPTTHSEIQKKFNTAAYNTNIGINAQFADNVNEEDDGQYRPPAGEDDGQYRPELYERELLSGAHSLNIAASGNRLPEDQRPRAKTHSPKTASQGSPRPFRPSPTTSIPVKQTRITEVFTTASLPQSVDSRTFDYFQTYTTTSRPTDIPGPIIDTDNRTPERLTTSAPRVVETRIPNRAPPRTSSSPAPAQAPSRPTTRAPHFARPANNKEDTSYDYAYYDSDPGFSEYEHIEEFGKTRTKV